MDKIEFHIQPSPESYDHEVRVLVNGSDIISNDMLGLDPVDGWEESFFGQPALTESGEFTYARCSCGIVGCGSDSVDISRNQHTVTWKRRASNGWSFVFDAEQYDNAVLSLKNDSSWETVERTAERLIRDLDFSRFTDYGLKFRWASGRMGKNDEDKVAVAFDLDEEGDGKYQVLCYAPWDHQKPIEAVRNLEKILQEPPSSWPNVVFYFQNQQSKLRRPQIAGAGWREFAIGR